MTSLPIIVEDLRSLGIAITDRGVGYPVEPAAFNPPANPDTIRQMEERGGARLPSDYRDFLLTCAGFCGMDFHNGYDVFKPELVLNLLDQDFQPQYVVVNGCKERVLAIAGDGGGNLFLFELAGRCQVWKWNHERLSGTVVEANSRSLTTIAQGFAAFLGRIAEDWRHYLANDRRWAYISG